MKILNIYFKNINSLEGESRIHFDKSPIVDGGVFAITGPNGSGKSSVLDAITLGLYGETFRFDRPAEHVMTKATAESFAEVEFALGGEKYKASWRVSRADDSSTGVMLSPEMKLVQLNGSEQILENSTQKVREKMLELTGMDFHKFSKSMVLAQGDFAAFLNALDSERMDILEKISGSDIYQEYQDQAEDKYNQAQKRQQQLEQDLIATPVMDDATKEAKQHDLEDFKAQQTELKSDLDEVMQQLTWVQNISALEKQGDSLDKQQHKLILEQENNQQDLDKIESSKEILVFEDELATFDNKTEGVTQSKRTLSDYRNEVEMLQKKLKSIHFDENTAVTTQALSQQKESIVELNLKLSELKFSLPKESDVLRSLEQQKTQKETALAETESWVQAHSADKTLLENFPDTTKLREIRAQLSELDAKQSSHSKWSKNTKKAIESKKNELVATKAKNEQLKESIAEDELAVEDITEGRSLQELQEMHIEQTERVLNFQELYDLAAVNSKLGNKGFLGQFFASRKEAKEEEQLKKDRELLQLEIGREKNLIATLELAVSNEALLKKMAEDRQSLIDGKACPLCGALEHPYSKHTPAASNSTGILKEQRKKIKTLIADEASMSKQIILAQEQAEKDDQKDDKLMHVRSQWNALANRLNTLSFELSIDNLSLMKDLLKTEKKELNNIVNLLKQTNKLQASILQAQETLTTNASSLERIAKESEVLSQEWEHRPKDVVDLDEAYNKIVEQEKTLAEKVEKQLLLLGDKMPKKAKEDAFFKSLTGRKQEFERQLQNSTSLAEEIKKLNESVSASSEKVTSLEQQVQQHSNDLLQQESAGMHLALTEKQKLIADKEAIVAEQENKLASLKQALSDKLKTTAASDIPGLRELLVFIARQDELQKQQLTLNEKGITLNSQQEKLKLQVEEQEVLAVTDQSEYDLTGQQSSIKRKLDIAKQEVMSLQNKLDKQDGLLLKRQEVEAKISSQKSELEVCEAELKLVASESKLHFRKKVQQVISDQLMAQTNQVLEKMSGRYYVRKVESEHGLALEIEDTKQQNVRRQPKTLSGGESFVISLALALGLAEMASSGHALDSLFIDEGFGNLDSEALYMAMTALENLQTHGKVVGVISHVEGVQKRIKTQIEMIKKPNGLSALKMVS